MAPETTVSVTRLGRRGYEKVALSTSGGDLFDLSVSVTEIDGAFLSTPWWEALADFDDDTLPPALASARTASCIEKPAAVLAETAQGAVALVAAALPAGANDPIVVPASGSNWLAGLAAVVGRDDYGATVAGYCLYLIVSPMHLPLASGSDAAICGEGMLSLGPRLVGPDLPLPFSVTLTVHGADVAPLSISLGVSVASTLAAPLSETIARLPPAALVLLRPDPGTAALPVLRPGMTVSAEAARLGKQERQCLAAPGGSPAWR